MNKKELLKKRMFLTESIKDAFSKVSREKFVPEELKHRAYEDTALPIGHKQTISQPYTIALMLYLLELKKEQKVLEIGSGCGYVLALLSEIVGKKGEIYGVERIKELAEISQKNLKNYNNITVYHMNGKNGLKEHSPFERILISAAVKEVPKNILNQLTDGGLLVAPVGYQFNCSLVGIRKTKNGMGMNKYILKEEIPGFTFVPFVEKD